jgi:hypothetical protein
MYKALVVMLAAGFGLMQAAVAMAPDPTHRPVMRPDMEMRPGGAVLRGMQKPAPRPRLSSRPVSPQAALAMALGPRPRPDTVRFLPLGGQTTVKSGPAKPAAKTLPRPRPRPTGLHRAGYVKPAWQTDLTDQTGSVVCGTPGILGVSVPPVIGPLPGCVIAKPVRVAAVSGVVLDPPALLDCPAARALNSWAQAALIPQVGARGGGVASIRVFSGYVCRTRNSRPGAKLSEHAKGQAIDIGGFGLRDGSELVIESGWRSAGQSALLQKLHAAACGTFKTVLGPSADRYHLDHFHFDTAPYRKAVYCR